MALGERVGLVGRPSGVLEVACLGLPPPLTLGPSWCRPHTHMCAHGCPPPCCHCRRVPAVCTPCLEPGGPRLTCPYWVGPCWPWVPWTWPSGPRGQGAPGSAPSSSVPTHRTPVLRAPAGSGAVSQWLLDREARTVSGVCLGPPSSGTPILPRPSLGTWSQDPVGAHRRSRVTPVAGFRGQSARVSLCVPEWIACAHMGTSGLEMHPQSLWALRAGSPAERQAWAVPGVCAARPGRSEGQGS